MLDTSRTVTVQGKTTITSLFTVRFAVILGLEVVGITTVSLILELSALAGDGIVIPVVEGGASSGRRVSLIRRLDTSEGSAGTAEADRIVHSTVVTVTDTVVGQSADGFTSGVSTSITLLNLVLNAELRIVSVQWAESIIQTDQSVTSPEWWLIISTAAFSTPTVGSRPDSFTLPILCTSGFSRVNFSPTIRINLNVGG